MSVYKIDGDILQGIIDYLGTKPYVEVVKHINGISNTVIEVKEEKPDKTGKDKNKDK